MQIVLLARDGKQLPELLLHLGPRRREALDEGTVRRSAASTRGSHIGARHMCVVDFIVPKVFFPLSEPLEDPHLPG